MKMNKEKILYSYAAGVIDGDGAIYLTKESNNGRPLYIPFIQVVKKYGKLITLFKENFGGMVGSLKPRLPHHAPLHYWRLKGCNNCQNFLEKTLEFLVFKKERASVLLEYIQQNPFVRGHILSSEQLMEREKYHLKIVQLNDKAYLEDINMVNKSLMNTVNPTFWSYIAGIMDTDGSFSVKRQKGHSETKNLRYLPQIQMSMASLDVINHIRKNCTFGTVCIAKNKSCQRGFHYAWSIGKKQDIIDFLKSIIPYLYEKKEQAQLLLDFCLNVKVIKNCSKGIPNEELEFREKMYQKIVALNKKGSLLCVS